MKGFKNKLIVLGLFIWSHNDAICQTQRDSSKIIEVEFVLKSASHGFRWRTTNPHPQEVYDKILSNPTEYINAFNDLVNKYFLEDNVQLTNRLASLMTKTNDTLTLNQLSKVLWRYKNEMLRKIIGSSLPDSIYFNRCKNEIKKAQMIILSFALEKNYKSDRIKEFCIYSLSSKENFLLFRNSLNYLFQLYRNDELLKKRLSLLLTEKNYHENKALEQLYHELFE